MKNIQTAKDAINILSQKKLKIQQDKKCIRKNTISSHQLGTGQEKTGYIAGDEV